MPREAAIHLPVLAVSAGSHLTSLQLLELLRAGHEGCSLILEGRCSNGYGCKEGRDDGDELHGCVSDGMSDVLVSIC